MANSVDPDQTAPIGTVCSGSTLFASILLKFASNTRQLFAADDFSRPHFQMHIFLGALRVKMAIRSRTVCNCVQSIPLRFLYFVRGRVFSCMCLLHYVSPGADPGFLERGSYVLMCVSSLC